MTLPKVSIITPSYNQAPFLEDTIRSILDQDYPNLEYIIIDGGSTDGSIEIIKKYADRLAFWISEPDQGQTDAINKGFSHATGEIFAWLNSDDTYEPGAVRKALEALQKHPEVSMVYGEANFINNTGKVIGKFPAAQTDYQKLRNGFVHIPQQASFFRAKYYQKVAPLDTSFYFAMDYDLWVRLAELAPFVFVKDTWANFRLHDDAKSIAADDRCWPEMLRVHRRLGGGIFSVIYGKYILRVILGPILRWRRRYWLKQQSS
ncbi:MAG: glycosyltransferase family 2 protein [Anaerolineaceae bacterium]